MTRPCAVLTAALLGLALAEGASLADEVSEAQALFKQGNAMFQGGDYAGALDRFNEAYSHWQNPKLLLNIGTALWQLGRLAEAADAYDRYMRDPEADPKRKQELVAKLKELDGKVARLRIVVDMAGAQTIIDGRAVRNEGQAALRVDPGSHTVLAIREGFTPAVVNVTVAVGEERTVALHLVPASAASSNAPSSSAAPTPSSVPSSPIPPQNAERHSAVSSVKRDGTSTSSSSGGVSTGYVVGGLGVLLTGVGTYYGLVAGAKWRDARDLHCVGGTCDHDGTVLIDEAKTAAWVSNIAFGAGVVGIGLGAYLVLRPAGNGRGAQSANMRVTPSITPACAGLQLRGGW